MHNRILWILQWLAGLFFIGFGLVHFLVPEGLPLMLSWMYDLSDGMHAAVGAAEILGGLGLILPTVTKVRPQLTVYAAVGLFVVMVSAAVWHFGREEFSNIGVNAVNGLILGYIAFGRARLAPISQP